MPNISQNDVLGVTLKKKLSVEIDIDAEHVSGGIAVDIPSSIMLYRAKRSRRRAEQSII